MGVRIDWVAVDCANPDALAGFWTRALDYEITYKAPPDDPDAEVLIAPRSGGGTRVLFLRVPEAKSVKNRLHFDLRPDDRDAEVRRLEELGATRVDIGQGDDVTWVVLADPEGNEFCVLRAEQPGEKP